MTTTHYLRIEAANLGHFIEDTQDLSTVRGAGLLLLDAVGFAASTLGVAEEKILSRGASAGLFEVATDDPAKLREELLLKLAAHPQFKHITFLVDTTPVTPLTAAETEFRGDIERLLAQNRARQLREPSLVVPEWNTSEVGPDEAFDRMRPAPEVEYVPDDTSAGANATKRVATSEFTLARRNCGREQRREFYRSIGVSDDAFCDDFHTLGSGDYGLLRGKLAIFYADGNKFGNLQRERCKAPETQRAFDKCIRDNRVALLKALIDSMQDDDRWWNTNSEGERVRRLETLLWGGDELIWVVPAWLGWEVAAFFFEKTKDWSFDGQGLTHSAGLVFASVKAPIQRLKKLAQNLAQLAKDTIQQRGITGRDRNLLAYDVLESFDFPSGDIAAGWQRRLARSGLVPGDLLMPGGRLAEFQQHARTLAADGFPTRQLHEHAHATLDGTRWETTLKDSNLSRFQSTLESAAGTTLHATVSPKRKAAWLHLAQLWNYTATTPQNKSLP